MRASALILAFLAMTGPAGAEIVQLYAAGSLKAALTDVSKAYEQSNGSKVEGKYGPSGVLKNEISGGAKADIFASANGASLRRFHRVAGRPEDPGKARLHTGTLDQQWRQIMKLSARNQLKGKIVDVKKGATTAHVRIDIGRQTLTASITNESADELKLEKGKTAYAIIKATSVMIGVD